MLSFVMGGFRRLCRLLLPFIFMTNRLILSTPRLLSPVDELELVNPVAVFTFSSIGSQGLTSHRGLLVGIYLFFGQRRFLEGLPPSSNLFHLLLPCLHPLLPLLREHT